MQYVIVFNKFEFNSPGVATFAAVRDPLYRCWGLLQHFQKHFAEIAVPIGASSLDEITVRTKARSPAKTYMPSKPDKYGLRFYAVSGWDYLYVHSLWDKGILHHLRLLNAILSSSRHFELRCTTLSHKKTLISTRSRQQRCE
eukprot:jgi/Phyca11/109554/e_gw1.17.655.1